MLETSPNKREELYDKYLQELSGIAFTFREIDIITCILHNRGEKRIASLLSISYRTVGAHVRNIMLKLSCNSRDQIIDFVEKSGKRQYCNQYYLHLIIQSFFETQLRKIGSIVNRNQVYCQIDSGHVTDEEWGLSRYLEEHLKLANIILVKGKEPSNSLGNRDDNILYGIYLVGEKFTDNYRKTSGDSVVLLVSENNNADEFKDTNYIDFRLTSQYYFAIFKLIEKITHKDSLEQIIKDFTTEYEKLQQSLQGSVPASDIGLGVVPKSSSKKRKLILLSLFCLLIGTTSLLYLHFKPKKADIPEINREFAEFIKNYSFEHIGVAEGLKKNLELLERLDKVVSNLDYQNMLNYLTSNKSSPEELLNYLYSLHAIGMNLLYNEYNQMKARKLLENAKDTIEKYLISKFNVAVDFNKLSPEEIYIELDIIDGLPAAYTKILYLLGRTYTYCDEDKRSLPPISQTDIDNVARYYDVAAYLGNKLKIFEGFLSVRSGVEMVRLLKIKNYIKQGDYERATKLIANSIRLLEELKKDHKQYIQDYRPGNYKHKVIIPANDNFNKVFLNEQIVIHYARLIKMTKDENQRGQYVDKISTYFIGGQNEEGIFDELEGIPLKRAAYLYNSLGEILLEFIEQNINFSKFQEQIEKKLNLEPGNELKLVEQIFNLAKTKSRNTYYTKVDSYDGLIKVYEKMLEKNNIDKQEKQDLKKHITELKQDRDDLKEQLEVKSLQ